MATILSAAAEPVSFTLGSYTVRFDLNTTDEHKVVIAKPYYSATFSGILYTGYGAQVLQVEPPHSLVTVVIMQYKRPINLGSEDSTTKRLLSDNGGCKEVATTERVIDGHQGYLTTSGECKNSTQGYVAQYLLDDIKGSGKVECLIASTYPWGNGTSSMLNTIHIVKQPGL
ncbi:MAG: hypothetical protein WB392_11285 [Methanotrichaceae archaeon]